MISTEKIVWVVADQYVGNLNQCLGVAEALGLPYQIKRVNYNLFGRLPNVILGATLVHVPRADRLPLGPPWPDVVIAAGRRTVPVARAIKKASLRRSFLVQTMWPGYPAGDLDLIATPRHDRVADRTNLIRTIGAPHNVSSKRLDEAAKIWESRLGHIKRPRVALLVGGSTRRHRFTTQMAKLLGQQVSELVESLGGGLMLSTSRRTEPIVRVTLIENIKTTKEIFVWCSESSENPYLAYLALSDTVVVTGDSTSMCTEASATGRPIFIFAPPGSTAEKHQRLHEFLYEYGCAMPLTSQMFGKAIESENYIPINDAVLIAQEIHRRIGS